MLSPNCENELLPMDDFLSGPIVTWENRSDILALFSRSQALCEEIQEIWTRISQTSRLRQEDADSFAGLLWQLSELSSELKRIDCE
ncbi:MULTISPECIES: hypothetical protein [unclassified Sinorhizobium]|uniref:hypothetical protein n=1 Tax=unclassified Sinorhizobium TaxID=2613772 RepID=UPI003523E29A